MQDVHMNKKILLVDDEPGVLATLKQYFTITGYDVLTASNGAEALKKVSSSFLCWPSCWAGSLSCSVSP